MRSVLAALLLVGCGGSTATPDGGPDGSKSDAWVSPWWRPAPGDANDWDIQLAAPIDLSANRTMYDLDLWSLVPAPTTLTYADGSSVTVPAGAQAGMIDALHARTPRAIVICHVDLGALELARPDAPEFPGYDAQMTTCPTAPVGVIGKAATSPSECYLDTRLASTQTYQQIVWKRLDLAKQIGCDGVDADRMDTSGVDTGFAIAPADEQNWYFVLASQAHARKLSVGMRDGIELSGLPDQLAPSFDWALVQRCGEFDDCDLPRPFINLGKAVLAIDYQIDGQGNGIDPAIACPRQQLAMIQDGLVKNDALTSAYRFQCTP